jgi:hypothetical protein
VVQSAVPLRADRLRHLVIAASCPAVVVGAILVANLPALVGLVDPNPLGPDGGLAIHEVGRLIPGNWYVDPDVGWTAQALGHRAALDWLHGQVPWWRRSMGSDGSGDRHDLPEDGSDQLPMPTD